MFKLIAAVDNNYAIGYNNKLLFNDSIDKAFFKDLTLGGVVIMGRKTFQSLPGELKDRENYVITRSPERYENKPGLFFGSIDKCLSIIANLPEDKRKKVWVIGGQEIYTELLDQCDEAYLTHVDTEYPETDAHFPRIDKMDEWKLKSIIKEYTSIISGWPVRVEFWKRSM